MHTPPGHREEIGKRIQREVEPPIRASSDRDEAWTLAQRRKILVRLPFGGSPAVLTPDDDLAELLAMDREQCPKRCVGRVGIAVPFGPGTMVF